MSTRCTNVRSGTARILIGASRFSSSTYLFKTLLSEIIKFLSYKVKASVYLGSKFTKIAENGRYLSRRTQASDLKSPKPNLEIYHRNFEYQSVAVWNKLDVNVRNATSIECFKARYFRPNVG